jgi:hypothetical protein
MSRERKLMNETGGNTLNVTNQKKKNVQKSNSKGPKDINTLFVADFEEP